MTSYFNRKGFFQVKKNLTENVLQCLICMLGIALVTRNICFQEGSYCNRNPCDSNLPTGESFGKTIDFHFSNCYVTNVSDVFMETVIMEMDIYNSAGLYVSRSMQVIYQIFMFFDDDNNNEVSDCF